MSPNLITIKLKGTHLNIDNLSTLKKLVKKVDATVLGPGLGLHPETKEAVRSLIEMVERTKKPLLLDADALKAFVKSRRKIKTPLVLTPHAEEYTILTGQKLSENIEERISELQKTASNEKAVIVLKGATDIIVDEKRLKLNLTGNPGMTVGGTGDVLSGIIGAFLAQQIDTFEAAVAGAFVNGAAGDFVYSEKGYHMVSTDLIPWIPFILNNPMKHLKARKTGAKTN
jgi:NAD(P)H-hydrate epimerase